MDEFVYDAIANLKHIIGCEDIVFKDSGRETYDGHIWVRGNEFVAEFKNIVSKSCFMSILNRLNGIKLHTDKPVMLISNFIPPSMADKLFNEDINVLDAAGNARIKSENLFIRISGEKSTRMYSKEKATKAFNETGLKLVFYLLLDDGNVNLTYRELSERTQLSLGAIKNVFEELKSKNFILVSKKGRFLKRKSDLIDLWQINYNMYLKPKLLLKRYTFTNRSDRGKWKDIALPSGMFWGGEAASFMVNEFLHPEYFDIYTEHNSQALLKTGLFIPAENGEVRVYQKFWTDNSMSNIVPKLLIYADLMGSGDSRCLEAANKLYDDEKLSI